MDRKLSVLKKRWESDPLNKEFLARYVYALKRLGKDNEVIKIISFMIRMASQGIIEEGETLPRNETINGGVWRLIPEETNEVSFSFPDDFGRPDGLQFKICYATSGPRVSYVLGKRLRERGEEYDGPLSGKDLYDSLEETANLPRLKIGLTLKEGLPAIFYSCFFNSYGTKKWLKFFVLIDEIDKYLKDVLVDELDRFYLPLKKTAEWLGIMRKKGLDSPEAVYENFKTDYPYPNDDASKAVCSIYAPHQKETMVYIDLEEEIEVPYHDQPTNASGKAFSSWATRKISKALGLSKIYNQKIKVNSDTKDYMCWDFYWRESYPWGSSSIEKISSSRSRNEYNFIRLTAYYPFLMYANPSVKKELSTYHAYPARHKTETATVNGLWVLEYGFKSTESTHDIGNFIGELIMLNFPKARIINI